MIDFALRIPQVALVRSRRVDTIEAHNEAIAQTGKVLVGKFGQPPTKERVSVLLDRIAKDQPTNLILISKVEGAFIGYRAPLTNVEFAAQKQAELSRGVPDYYSKFEELPSCYFEIKSTLQPCNLADYRLLSNGRSLLTVMAECRTVAFLLKRTTAVRAA